MTDTTAPQIPAPLVRWIAETVERRMCSYFDSKTKIGALVIAENRDAEWIAILRGISLEQLGELHAALERGLAAAPPARVH